MVFVRSLIAGLLASPLLIASAQEAPKVNDPALKVDLFASEPLIQTPIGMTFDKAGRLIVIESQTHFRPKDWKGPEHDQIVWLKDTDNDGKADARQVIFSDSDMTMDIATHEDGSLYLSTRNEILRLRDKDGDGVYETVDRKLVWLETEGRYPHNGLSGLAFDVNGGLYFGMGENLGAAYTLTGADGESFKDQGEGGNIWHVTADGKRLHKVATGFWNPFGVCTDSFGNVFATDNDPDSSPPCRLHHIIEGGDYGYQFRYGRSGLHPFISWNGELPGTLPMMAGTGEAPCDVLSYAPAPMKLFNGLSPSWHGTLLVASWVDHRVESHRLKPRDGTFSSKMTLLMEGGQDFRPVAFAVAPDGALFVSDWVKRSYELHGFGRVWRVAAKETASLVASPVKPYPADPLSAMRERILSGPAPSDQEVLQWLTFKQPYLQSAFITRMSHEGEQLRELASISVATLTADELSSLQGESSAPLIKEAPVVEPGKSAHAGQKEERLHPLDTFGSATTDRLVLLACRRALENEGQTINDMARKLITRAVWSADDDMVLLGLKWISDYRLVRFRTLVQSRGKDKKLSPRVYYALVTTLARLDSEKTTEADLVKLLKADITSPDVSISRKRLALEILPDRDRNTSVKELEPLLALAKAGDRQWLVHYIATLHDAARLPLMKRMAFDDNEPAAVRADALVHAELSGEEAKLTAALAAKDKTDPALRLAALQILPGVEIGSENRTLLNNVSDPDLVPATRRVQGQPFFPNNRPALTSTNIWQGYLDGVSGKPDLENGRRVFMSPKLGGCAVCHRAEGIGGIAGPNLSTIARGGDTTYLLESLLQPNRNVAPQYEAFTLTTKDGLSRVAFRLIERGNIHSYVDISGKTFDVNIEDIIARNPLPVSIMPEGLVTKLTDLELRDLVAYLKSLAAK